MSSSKPSRRTVAGYRLIYGGAWLVGQLPHWFLYHVVAEILYFLIYKTARYRVAVVRANLQSAFPEKSQRELRSIERGFYRNLSEYFVDSLKLASLTKKTLLKRMVTLGADKLAAELGGRNCIVMFAHSGSWELRDSYAYYPDMPVVVAAYRPLKNKTFDMYFRKVRNRLGKSFSVPMNELMRFYINHKDGIDGYPLSLMLIADQNAPVDAQSHWIPFLNHPTVFFRGAEKMGLKFGIPVYYGHIRKVKRGYYEQWFECIWDGASPVAEHEITTRYAALLEAEIRQAPEMWMWSHRRWKHRLEGEKLAAFNEKWGTDFK